MKRSHLRIQHLTRYFMSGVLASALAACGSSTDLSADFEDDSKTDNATAVDARALLSPDQYYKERLGELLDRAEESIDVIQFELFSENGSVSELVDHLIALKQARPQLHIRVMVEGDEDDFKARNQATLDKLTAVGAEVALDAKGRVTHTKAWCVDQKSVLVGSTNMSNTSIDKNNEINAIVNSAPIGAAFTRYFDALWNTSKVQHPGMTTDGELTLIQDASYLEQAIDIIESASKTLDIAMYKIKWRSGSDQDAGVEQILKALKSARERGVAIRLFTERAIDPNGYINTEKVEALNLLASAGVKIYWDRPEKITHSKYIIADRQEVLLGSTNWYWADLAEAHQLNLRIDNPRLARWLAQRHTDKIRTEGTAYTE